MSSSVLHWLTLVAFMISAAGSDPPGAANPPGAVKPPKPAGESAPAPRSDKDRPALPRGAIARLGELRLRHGGKVLNLLFTRDGKGLISAGDEPIIRLWDPSTGKETLTFTGHEGQVYSIALSPDGKVLASGGEDQKIRLWDVASGRELRHWSVAEDARLQVAFSPNGKELASGGIGNSIVFWDIDTGKELRQLKGHERDRFNRWGSSEGGTLLSLAFAPDGRYLLVAQTDGLFLWDLAAGKRVRSYETSRGGWQVGNVSSSDVSRCISFAVDGDCFVTPGDHNGLIRIWELHSVEERARLEGHERVVMAVRFAPDGKTLASADYNGALRIWDAHDFKALQTIEIGQEPITDLAISPDGQTVALGYPHGRIRLWDLKTGKERLAGERPEPAVAVALSTDGRTVVSLEHRSIRQYDATSGKELRQTKLTEDKEPALLRLSADRRRVVQARAAQPIRLLDATTGKTSRVLEGKHESVFILAIAPDGNTVAAATTDSDEARGNLRVWDAQSGKELQHWPAPLGGVTALAISPDGRSVAAVEANGAVRLWELATGKERRRLAIPARPRLFDDSVLERHLVMRMRRQREEDSPEGASPVAFSPDGKGLAVCEGETIRLWDLASGQIVRRFACDTIITSELAFSPDGQLLAAGGPDNAVWIWNRANSEVLARLKGHRGPINRLAFSADGKALVSASEDGTAVVWEVSLALTPRFQPRPQPSEQDLESLWTDLADADAARAYTAIVKLADSPQRAVGLISAHLRPAAAADSQRVARLIADLDSEKFQVRQKVADELEQLHELAGPALSKALTARPSLEARRRLEELREKVQRRQLPAGTVRALRAVEVLETIATSGKDLSLCQQARQQLETLAGGAPEAWLTREAKAARQRLNQSTDSPSPPPPQSRDRQ